MTKAYNLSEISTIIFDLGGVILNLDYNLTINAFKELGGENFDQLYTQAYQDNIIDQYETGQISSRAFLDYMKGFIPKHISDQQIINAWNAMLLDLPAERIDLLNKIKDRFQIYLFSNTNDIHYKNFTSFIGEKFGDPDLLDSLFIQTYYSHKVGKRKPNADAFEKVIDDHNLDPSKTLFIDDSEQHIVGASKVGLQTIHLVDEDIIDIFDTSNL